MKNFPVWPIFGTIVGIVLGFAGAFGGFGAFLIVLVMSVVGFLIGFFAQVGPVDLSRLSARRQ